MRVYIFLLVFFQMLGVANAYLPKDGVVPNKEVAVKLAEVILQQIYGAQVLDQKPFMAELKKGVWIVDGTFHCPEGTGCMGGAAHIEIQKKDGRVNHIEHGK